MFRTKKCVLLTTKLKLLLDIKIIKIEIAFKNKDFIACSQKWFK